MRAEPGESLSFWTLAGGFAFAREEMKNTYVTDSNSNEFPAAPRQRRHLSG